MPLVEILPPSDNVDRALALGSPVGAVAHGSSSHADLELVNTHVEGVSCDDLTPSDPEGEASKEATIRGSRSIIKRRLDWLV